MGRISQRIIPWLAVVTLVTPAAATDLSGRWHIELTLSGPTPPFVELQQTGDSVAIPTIAFFQGGGAPETVTATLTSDSLTSPSFGLDSLVKADGNMIHGTVSITVFPYGTSTSVFLANRCECYDGNAIDGDGCDASCRIEPCYDCAGDPSICVPSSEGASCDDRRDCTTGETCSAGACSGTAIASCTDMTGRWITQSDSITHLIRDIRDVEQRDGFLRLRAAYGQLTEFGSIDPLTGGFELSVVRDLGSDSRYLDYLDLNRPASSCGDTSSTGSVAADGQTFADSGTASEAYQIYVHGAFMPGGCLGHGPYTRSGQRCGSGECLERPDECPPCQARNEVGVCETGPRSGCLRSVEPRRSSIKITDSIDETDDRLRWKWQTGAALDTFLLGGPVTNETGMQVCVFDESTGEPQLLFSTYLRPGYNWETSATGLVFKRKTEIGKETVAWRPGVDGKSSMMLSAVGGAGDGSGLADGIDFLNSSWYQTFYPGLPTSPLGLPLRVQGQMDRGGACFESVFDSLGVRKNEYGSFTGKASQ